jgi:hypothetical protein
MEDSGASTHAPTALVLGRVSSLLLCQLATLLFLLLLPHGNYRLCDTTESQSHTWSFSLILASVSDLRARHLQRQPPHVHART